MFKRKSLLPSLVYMVVMLPGVISGAESKSDQKTLDRRMEKSLREVIRLGANVFNKDQDAAGCARLFQGALMAVQPLLDHRPSLQVDIHRGLADVRGKTTWEERAFALRSVLDKACDELNPTKPAKKQEEVKKGPDFELSGPEKALLVLTNKERKQAGLPPLQANKKLCNAARAHSANMARHGRIDHMLDDKGPGERLQDVGYESAGWGENCAAGQRTPEEAISSWMNSEGHRSNILGSQYKEIGIGIAGGDVGLYFTQVFATPAR